MLKLDFYFVFSFAAQLIPSQKLQYDETITETILVFVLGAVGLSLALFSVKRENKYMMLIVMLGGTASLAYFSFRLSKIWIIRPSGADPYEFTRSFLTFTTVVTMALILMTLGILAKNLWNVWHGVLVFTNPAQHVKAPGYKPHSMPIDHGSEELELELDGTYHYDRKSDAIDNMDASYEQLQKSSSTATPSNKMYDL
jgi:hypothetical protein